MPVRLTITGGVAVIRCTGSCDLESAPDMEDALASAVRRGVRLVLIDLSHARYLDSHGVRVLLRARGEMEALAGKLVVVGLQWQPRRALDVVGLRNVIPCVTSREEGMSYLKDPSYAPLSEV